MMKMKTVILYASIVLASGILFVNIYNSLVDARNWGANIPNLLKLRGHMLVKQILVIFSGYLHHLIRSLP